jgi:hypothetical protein
MFACHFLGGASSHALSWIYVIAAIQRRQARIPPLIGSGYAGALATVLYRHPRSYERPAFCRHTPLLLRWSRGAEEAEVFGVG